MKDSARVIRAVCKRNPNDGIYDSISSDPLAELPSFLHLIAKDCVEEVKVSEQKGSKAEKHRLQCATCFAQIDQGAFALSSERLLLFCQKCSLVPQNNLWKVSALVLLVALVGVFIWLQCA